MSIVYVEAGPDAAETLSLVCAAVESERLRLARFEHKYGVTSEQFIADMAAEDLEGKDDEYVQWAGEYRLTERLKTRVTRIQEICFGA